MYGNITACVSFQFPKISLLKAGTLKYTYKGTFVYSYNSVHYKSVWDVQSTANKSYKLVIKTTFPDIKRWNCTFLIVKETESFN